MHAVMVKGCGGCPFHRYRHSALDGRPWECTHPNAPADLRMSPTVGLPAECPLRRWSVLVQAAEPERVEAAGPYRDKRAAGREGE